MLCVQMTDIWNVNAILIGYKKTHRACVSDSKMSTKPIVQRKINLHKKKGNPGYLFIISGTESKQSKLN